jgi:hypothetical protein
VTDALEHVRHDVAEHLEGIKSMFVAGAKISVFVRHPGYPDRDFVLTDDNLAEVIKMVRRRDPAAWREIERAPPEAPIKDENNG